MKSKNKPLFSPKNLTQAVAVGLVMLSAGAYANSSTGTTGGTATPTSGSFATHTTSIKRGTTNAATNNFGINVSQFQTIGDLEIYQAATAGSVTMTMMLDISGSMENCANGELNDLVNKNNLRFQNYFLKDAAGNTVQSVVDENGNTVDISKGISVMYRYCGTNQTSRTRMGELQHALLELFSDGRRLPEHYKIGIGHFPAYGDGSARIAAPAKELTVEHRYRLMREVADLRPQGFTPSAPAIAEAGAYMMGRTTTKFKAGASTKEAYITKAWADGADVLQDVSSPNTVMVNCDSYRLLRFEGGNWNQRFFVSAGQMLNHGGRDTSSVAQFINSVIRRDSAGKLWVNCLGVGRAHSIGDERYTDFAKYGLSASAFSAGLSRIDGLDFRYAGHITHMYVDGRTIPIKNYKNPGAIFSPRSANSGSAWDRNPVLLGEKVRYVEEEEDLNGTVGIRNSGFSISKEDTKKPDLRSYQSPLSDDRKTCDGAGVFFLTDGFPNVDSYQHPMMLSLGRAYNGETSANNELARDSNNFTPLPSNQNNDPKLGVGSSMSGWTQMGQYARILRDPNKTKVSTPILTATMGFGASFGQSVNTRTIKNSEGEDVTVVNCDEYSAVDVKNLCKLGEFGYGYGEGGFSAASDAQSVADSIVRFAGRLHQNINNQPAGTISVPKDPLSVTNIQPYAYLPMIAPEVAKPDALWKGNLKKYHTLNGTLYGKDAKTRLYQKSSRATTENKDYPSEFNPNAQDIWQTGTESGGKINVGGTYGTIKDIKKDGLNSRTLWIENYKNYIEGDPTSYIDKEIVEVKIKDGAIVGLFDLGAPYTVQDKAYILNYLGVNVPVETGRVATSDAALKRAFETALRAGNFHDTLLGGVLHSVPVLATYRGEFEADGSISSDEAVRQDHILYGSMDGALHLVEAKTGQENFAFVPRAMFEDETQRHAMLTGAINYDNRTGQPKFGVDAPWVTHAEYIYNFNKTDSKGNPSPEVTAKTMYAFGGLRMGGNGIYGLDITNRDVPKLNFSISRWMDRFERMGQIWAKPTVAKIKTGPKPRDVKDVVIFGGGYDMCYEHPLFKLGETTSLLQIDTTYLKNDQVLPTANASCTQTEAMGNAVYMVDAKTGSLLARWQFDSASGDGRQHMKHSVVGEIATLDSNNNGAIDHLYFADLGGQVFRVDLKEQASGSAMTRRVVRVFDANGHSGASSADHINYRFYDKPLVTFHNHGKKSFAVVNIASGDRSSPVHTHRTTQNPNRIYGIFDRDLTTDKLDRASLAADKLLSNNITADNLEKIDTKEVEIGGDTKVKSIIEALKAGVETADATNKTVKQGWYYDMIRFDGRINVSGLKSIGLGTVIGSVYYANIYSPSYEYTKAGDCSARVSGGTERQLYCLPWGICANSDTYKLTNKDSNGVLGYIKAGPGIQELTIGTVTNTAGKSGNFRTVLGHQSLSEISAADKTAGARPTTQPGADSNSGLARLPHPNDVGTGTGTDVYGQNVLVQPRYTLAVQRWYDLQNENQSN